MDLFNLKLLKESASAVVIEAFQFDEDATIVETLTEADAMLSDMSADIDTNHTNAAEIVMEAYISGSANVLPISELSLKGIGKSVKEFFDKLVAMVKGIIEKIKQRFALSTRNRSEFIARFNEAYGKRTDKTGSKFTYTGYKWNAAYLKTDLSSAIKAMAKENSDELSAKANEFKDIKKTTGPDGLTMKMKALKEELGKIRSKKFNINNINIERGASAAEAALLARKSARGTEKVTMKISDIGISNMLTFIENSKSSYEALTDAYTSIKETFQEIGTIFDDLEKMDWDPGFLYDAAGNKTENSTTPAEKARITEAQKYFKEAITMLKDTASYTLTGINTLVKAAQTVSEEATRDFMGALKSFVLSKDDKK